MVVCAEVVDIRRYAPRKDDRFLIDSCVLFWLYYSKASFAAQSYQVRHYASFVKRTLDTGAGLICCGLSLSELAHAIERSERTVYEAIHGCTSIKEYRAISTERAAVCAEVKAAWLQAIAATDLMTMSLTPALCDAALSRLHACPLDGYDALMLCGGTEASLTNLLTDDRDFAAASGIRVFTANPEVIGEARAAGRLMAD